MRRFLPVLLLVFHCTAPYCAAGKPDRNVVEKLVTDLGSASRRDRELAEENLVASGPEVLDLLPQSAGSPAVSAALDRIRRELEQEAARLAGLASRISLTGQRSWSDIEKAFHDQTGQVIRLAGIRAPSGPLDWTEKPFWDAVRELETQTGTSAAPERAAEALFLRPLTNKTESAVATSGPCRVELVGVSERANLVDPTMSLLTARWRVRTEPRLRPLYLIVADRQCSLGMGPERFAPLSPDARREIPCDRWDGCEIDTAFQAPRGVDRSKLEFSADATLKVAALPLRLRFDDLQVPVPRPLRRGAVTGAVRRVKADPGAGTISLELTVSYERGGPEFESHRMWIYQNAAWLELSEGGEAIVPESVDLKEISSTGATLGFTFDNVVAPAADLTFVYEAPSLVIDVPVRVTGLPVPVTQ
ncbi:hypothetical protein Pan44_31080 [Caulifigura coniformis]|uniref:Uncharacterized protein n=1 Tax=Caulifigura coniformis TaxID=2527983 RepID=A0A517SG63_9PLAN|nr:hypothetical protein [Caulifigura coniformis]QDT55067.1 hypothetical protein Pan44_31080 [Caulifigura coniformis]